MYVCMNQYQKRAEHVEGDEIRKREAAAAEFSGVVRAWVTDGERVIGHGHHHLLPRLARSRPTNMHTRRLKPRLHGYPSTNDNVWHRATSRVVLRTVNVC